MWSIFDGPQWVGIYVTGDIFKVTQPSASLQSGSEASQRRAQQNVINPNVLPSSQGE